MVSIRSLTCHSCPIGGPARWQGGGDASRHVVPARPAPRGQPGSARGRRRDGDGAAAVRASTRRCGARPDRPAAPTWPRSLRALDVPRRPDRSARGDPVAEVVRGRARGRGRRGCTSRADFGPYGRARDERGRARRWPSTASSWSAPGSPYAVAPGRVTKRRRRALPGLHAVLAGLGRARLARPGRRTRGPVSWLTGRVRRRSRTRRCPDGLDAAGGRRGGGARRRWRAYVARPARRPTTDERDRPDLDAHLAHVGAPEVGRDPPAHDARRPRAAARPRRRDVPQGAGLARVLRRRAVPPPRDRARLPPAGVRAGWRTTSRATSSTPGARAAPATRSSTPACASCGRPAGCTTGCG